jgi:hypothetical protein
MTRKIAKVPTDTTAQRELFSAWLRLGLHKSQKTEAGLADVLRVEPAEIERMLKGVRRIGADELDEISRYIEQPVPIVGVQQSREREPTAKLVPATKEANKLFSATEAAQRLGISIKTLRGHVNDGSLPKVITGRGRVRPGYGFHEDDLERFERDRRQWSADRAEVPRRGRRRTLLNFGQSSIFDDVLKPRR